MLGDQPLQPHQAGVAEQIRPDLALLGQEDAVDAATAPVGGETTGAVQGWGLWCTNGGRYESDLNSGAKSGTIVLKHSVPRYSVLITILVVSWRLIRKE